MSNPIEIHLNGKVTRLEQGAFLSDMLAQHSVNLKQVAIEHNRVIIPRTQLGSVQLQSGDQVEIVSFIGGG